MIETAIILAAGRGNKIWPYGDTWPKAALPVANRPIIRWQIDALKKCGVKNIVVVTGHLSGQVRDAVSGLAGIQCMEQKSIGGTADALMIGLAFVKDQEFAVIYGDVLFAEEDLRSLLQSAPDKEAIAALVQPLGANPPHEWLCANLENHRIAQILGHPREASHRLCGVYRLSRAMLPRLADNPGLMTSVEVGNMPPLESELAESISRYIQSGGTMRAVETKGFFIDIDKPWHLLEANSARLKQMGARLLTNEIAPGAKVEEGAEIAGPVVLGEGTIIGRGVKIKGPLWTGKNVRIIDGAIVGANTVIGDGAIVREYCKIEPESAIGAHCVVGHAAEFGGILMDGAYSYHYGEYWGITGRSADLGAATVCGNLRFDDQNTLHRIKGRRENPNSHCANASYLGDYTRTGVNAILMPGVKVGPYSIIGAGVILQEDLPNNTLIYVKQELARTTWGPQKYGW